MGYGRSIVGAVVAMVTLVAPTGGEAATTVGLSFNPTMNCRSFPQTYYGQKSTAPDPYVIPAAGVITSWTFRTAGSGFAVFKLKVGTSSTSRIVRTDAESEPVTVLPNTATANPARIPVVAGQRIGFFTDVASPCIMSGVGGVDDSVFSNTITPADQPPGATSGYQPAGAWSFPLSVKVEPDADRDGYGDESQDACPAVTGPGACPKPDPTPTPPPDPTAPTPAPAPTPPVAPEPPDNTAPVLGPLSLSASSFRASKGAKLNFVLSESGKVVVTVERQGSGRRVAGGCKARTARNAARTPCRRWVKLGSIVQAGVAGKNSIALARRIRGKRLTPGRYRLTARATDASGNVSLSARKIFTVLR